MLDIHLYIKQAVWATEKYALDDAFTGLEYQAQLQKELDQFWELTKSLYSQKEIDRNLIEYHFFLTRNGHEDGFLDGNYVHGNQLTAIARTFGTDYGF